MQRNDEYKLYKLINAVLKNDVEAVQALLKTKNLSSFINKTNYYGSTALMLAVQNRHITIVKNLLAAGADPNIADNCGMSPLYESAYYNYAEIIPLLLQHGAKIDLCEEYDCNPLHIAAGYNSLRAMKQLLEAKSLTNEIFNKKMLWHKAYEQTPLEHAIMKRNYKIAEMLIQHGIKHNFISMEEL